jgi:hypothetical protein
MIVPVRYTPYDVSSALETIPFPDRKDPMVDVPAIKVHLGDEYEGLLVVYIVKTPQTHDKYLALDGSFRPLTRIFQPSDLTVEEALQPENAISFLNSRKEVFGVAGHVFTYIYWDNFCYNCKAYVGEDHYLVEDMIWEETKLGRNALCISCLEEHVGRKMSWLDFSARSGYNLTLSTTGTKKSDLLLDRLRNAEGYSLSDLEIITSNHKLHNAKLASGAS